MPEKQASNEAPCCSHSALAERALLPRRAGALAACHGHERAARCAPGELARRRPAAPPPPAAWIFGANGSGSFNLLEATDDMRFYVVNSFRRTGEMLPRWPFRLDPDFEVLLLEVRDRHRAWEAFATSTVSCSTGERVHEEWAVRYPRGKAARLFSRQA